MQKHFTPATRPDRGPGKKAEFQRWRPTAMADLRILPQRARGAAVINASGRGHTFRRDLLPGPLDYFRGEEIQLSGRGLWRDALCPFHTDTRPSLRINAETGAFRCMACGASGGDVLDFHQRRHALGFIEAARSLGAWGPA